MNTPPANQPIDILLVEDSATDALLTQYAFASARIPNRVHLAEDGEKALAFLRKQPPYENAPRPHLILLDLNMPRKNGHEVLLEVKADESLRIIPAIVLTSSSAEEDVLASYQRHANAYITKPHGMDNFNKAVAGIENFWFSIATPPPPHA